MKLRALALTAALTTAIAGPVAAQDYNNWGTISPWGLEMQDQYGGYHYVDPYAYDSQVDAYGNVYSDYNGTMDPSVGMYDLAPATYGDYGGGYGGGYSAPVNDNPYAGRTDSHGKFLESIWE